MKSSCFRWCVASLAAAGLLAGAAMAQDRTEGFPKFPVYDPNDPALKGLGRLPDLNTPEFRAKMQKDLEESGERFRQRSEERSRPGAPAARPVPAPSARQEASQPAPANPAMMATEPAPARQVRAAPKPASAPEKPTCIFKPVMTDADIAACR